MNVQHRPVNLGPYEATVEQRGDGTFVIRSTAALGPYPRRYTEWLERWARERPQLTFIAERTADGGWRQVSYAEALAAVRRLAQALLTFDLSADRPLMLLSGNDIEHALLALAAMHVGIASVAVSPAWSLVSQDHARLRHAVELLTPGLVFASDAEPYAAAIAAAVPADTPLLFTRGTFEGRRALSHAELDATEPTAAVDAAHDRVGPDTIAKFLFTSGSTRLPKAVVNTHRMMCCNMAMYGQCYPFFDDEPPVLVDWLPWHHTAGSNANLGIAVTHGGTLYIDAGKPTDAGIAETLRNLREISPTFYCNVPRALGALATAMQRDAALRDTFFKRLKLILPVGAAMPPPLKRAIDELATASVGAPVVMNSGLGMTEAGPFAMAANVPWYRDGAIGLPGAGIDLKLAPAHGKLEIRLRGPNITPGYWRQPETTRAAFDDEGYYCTGDAARFIDPATPDLGLKFDGRIAEDFKLTTGTWVNAGALRDMAVAAGAPYVHDIVLTGHDRDALGMLVFLLPSAAALSPLLRAGATLAEIAADAQVRAWAQALLDRVAAQGTGSASRIERALLLAEPASMDSGECTDKGSINQRMVLTLRAHLVETLYAEATPHPVLVATTNPRQP